MHRYLLLLAIAATWLVLVTSAPAADPGCPLTNYQSNGTYCQNICERCGCDGFKCGSNCLCECHSHMSLEEEHCIQSVQSVANNCDPPCDFLSELPYDRVIRAAKLKAMKKEKKLQAKQGNDKRQRRIGGRNKVGLQRKNERVTARRRKQKTTTKEDKPKQSTPEHLIKTDVKPTTKVVVTPTEKLQVKSQAVQSSGPHNKLIVTPPHLL